jgi:cytochrome c oxidase cbb3-type subunit 3
MPRIHRSRRCLPALVPLLALLVGAGPALAQDANPPTGTPVQPGPVQPAPLDAPQAVPAQPYAGGGSADRLLGTPVSGLAPGNVALQPTVKNPVAGDPQAATRGMQYFNAMNCVGCHAPNGAGGMGPSLSNRFFIYGDTPANIYLSIYQGRPHGMPAWGAMLPDSVIWDLVAYIKSISQAPTTEWGTTFSAQALDREQVPAEYAQTPQPWGETEAFSHGQKPNSAK